MYGIVKLFAVDVEVASIDVFIGNFLLKYNSPTLPYIID